MKRAIVVFLFFVSIFYSCEEELSISEAGNLVPLTVDQNPLLPSISINETLLHTETYGDPNNTMLLFLHGGPGGDYQSAQNIKQLANDGFFIVFYDQRGSGLSQRHTKDIYTIQLLLDDITAVIEYYRSSENQNVILFGHSWGGILAAAYINKYPNVIDGAIFAEPGGFNKNLLDKYAEKSRALNPFSESSNDVFYFDQFITGKENEHTVLDYKLALTTSYAYARGNTEGIEGPSPFNRMGAVVLQAMIDISENEGYDFTTNLNQYQEKVLFLYGENNESYGLSFAEEEASFFNDYEIVQIDDTGHEMIYFKWENVYPIVLNYLNSI